MSALHRFTALVIFCLAFSDAYASKAPRVVADIKPIHSLLTGIMQGIAEPLLLMDGSEAPAAFRPSEKQRAALANADLIVWTGPELSSALGDVIHETAAPSRVFEVLSSDEIKVLPSRGQTDARDAFFWLDSRNMLILLDELTRILSHIDPQNAHRYEHNRARVLTPIAEGDRQMEFGYRDVSGIAVFFYHDTHQYFEQAYAMKVAGSVASPPGSAAGGAAGIIALKGWLSEAPRHCLFTETSLAEPHLDLLLADSEVKPIELDSLGSKLQPGPGLYVELMQQNFAAISTCANRLKPQSAPTTSTGPEVALFPEKVMPRYLLMDQNGQTVTTDDFQGDFQLIYFGYTFCPDICPTSLTSLAMAMQLLGAQSAQVQPLFITVDPERDTPAALKRYVGYFHPRLLGLSGSLAMTKRTAENFKARYEKISSQSDDPQRYSMDHTAGLYLLGRNGEFLTKFAHGLPAQEIAERIREYMQSPG